MGHRTKAALDSLKDAALKIERLATTEVASSAAKGIAEELREQMPDELSGELRALADDLIALLRSFAEGALTPGAANAAVHSLSVSATRGALDELERQWRDGGLPLHAFIERLNNLIDRAAAFAESRALDLRNPEERARKIAVSAVDGATERVRESVPRFAEDLRAFTPVSRELASAVGESLLGSLKDAARRDPDAFTPLLRNAGRAWAEGMAEGFTEKLRRPAIAAALSSVGVAALMLFSRRRRR